MTRIASFLSRGLGGCALALALLLSAGGATAKLTQAELGLQHAGARCDGKNSFGYTATWRGAPNATFQVNSGNGCHLGDSGCGVSNSDCVVRCSVTGTCRATLRACQVGRGAYWGGVMATDRSVFQKMPVAPPGKCS